MIKQVFDAFEAAGIEYVHFKSNLNLDKSFQGKADFDVLINRKQRREVVEILSRCGAKQFIAPSEKSYSGVENWLVFDNGNGVIYHLHMHYQIKTGKQFVKDYVLPWEDICLEQRIKNKTFGIYTTSPEVELLLLTVRIVLKSRWKDSAKARLGKYNLHYSLEEERIDLLNRIDGLALEQIISQIISEPWRQDFMNIATSSAISGKQFLRLSYIVRKELFFTRSFSGLYSQMLSVYNSICYRIKKYQKRKGKCIVAQKKSSSTGLIIAFVGVDGAGKSTVTKEITAWLSKHIECKRFYMGEGEATTNIFVRLYKKFLSKYSAHRPKKPVSETNGQVAAPKKISIRKRIISLVVVNILSMIQKGNYQNIIRMNRYKQAGGISLLDRYPQLESPGSNDGLKMYKYEDVFGSKSRMLKKFKEKELKYLSIVKKIKPDLVFRLNITIDTSMKRKPEQTNRTMFENKLSELQGITFQNAQIINIDAEQPYEDELLEIKKIIWKYI